ncbi:hypothetical protein [Deinococcus misasensis]|uniref:hypothetical protein n=1 Tax=Deinococcus misasensis TaxID=392413 RepID=UPI000556E35E|nr:hypothetical protein [Deinococcus misasensis]
MQDPARHSFDAPSIHHVTAAFHSCTRYYEALRAHRGFRMMPPEMADQLDLCVQDVQDSLARLQGCLDSGRMTPELLQEAHAYVQCHMDMVMDLFTGLNGLSGVQKN